MRKFEYLSFLYLVKNPALQKKKINNFKLIKKN